MDELTDVWTFVGKLAFYAGIIIMVGFLLAGLYVDVAGNDLVIPGE